MEFDRQVDRYGHTVRVINAEHVVKIAKVGNYASPSLWRAALITWNTVALNDAASATRFIKALEAAMTEAEWLDYHYKTGSVAQLQLPVAEGEHT